MKKIIAIDLAAIIGFALLVLYPNAIGGILVLAAGLGFVWVVLSAVIPQWTWKDTAIVASPFVIGALRRAGRQEH
jgi:hypothetical protein